MHMIPVSSSNTQPMGLYAFQTTMHRVYLSQVHMPDKIFQAGLYKSHFCSSFLFSPYRYSVALKELYECITGKARCDNA